MNYVLDWKQYSSLARQAAAEGCVLLRNENAALPLVPGDTVAVFGRIQLDYYKSGTGSGGLVNVPYVHSILDGLREYEGQNIRIYEPLLNTYREWVKEHPFDKGVGWANEPWCQQEMPLDDALVQDAAAHANAVLIILGRTAGEDQDNSGAPGSYYLTDNELDMLKKVCAVFPRSTVVLNTGNIISMKWVDEVAPGAILYVWQGGMEGGCGAADVLCGKVSPCGKLSDTIAKELEDYPSTKNFGGEDFNYYQEDIYVGYRYFETFAPDKVMYPFGYGLSYTDFTIESSMSAVPTLTDTETAKTASVKAVTVNVEAVRAEAVKAEILIAETVKAENVRAEAVKAGTVNAEAVKAEPVIPCAPSENEPSVDLTGINAASTYLTVTSTVTNVGSYPGKEVVQVYCCPPQGKLGKPLRNLCAFGKTKELKSGEKETVTLVISLSDLASYDDSGAAGHRSCYVLEGGTYYIYAGANVRDAALAGSFTILETLVVQQCQEAMAPVMAFDRFRPQVSTAASAGQTAECATNVTDKKSSIAAVSGSSGPSEALTAPLELTFEPVPLRTVSPTLRRRERLPKCLPYTGDEGFRLADVADGSISMDVFLAQLSDEDLMDMSRGEGMCSPKVTPGTAAAFGGVTDTLQDFGIPVGCCSDGPSGIRMDCGTSAFSQPNGTLLACTFNVPLVTELFTMEGLELYSNKIDSLLGPGINIHRNPLNGRNFEYHSEDPYLTGRMAQAQVTGMDRYSISGTMKHFCANNQEYRRHEVCGVISERALREIYLKPFEMGVRSGHTRSIMTTYGPVNGIWTAGNYDLNTTILRGEWNYQGIVMTDWWAQVNDDGFKASRENLAAMVRAQNDIYMVTQDALTFHDNQPQSLKDGSLTRAELVRNAANICRFLIVSPAMRRLLGTYREVTHVNVPEAMELSGEQEMEAYTVSDDTTISFDGLRPETGSSFTLALSFPKNGVYRFSLAAASHGNDLAQMNATLSFDNTVMYTCTWHGESKKSESSTERVVFGPNHYLKLHFSQSGLELDSLRIQFIEELHM
ncbi:MAG: glycoside hydrolase family 3 C-terminal domain-containing protein [Lachnospiraceae bacterium]|nr:glycoside hydrolase family 3 C-terminal domain-containing protein [Lachnospiraceae bacterium]